MAGHEGRLQVKKSRTWPCVLEWRSKAGKLAQRIRALLLLQRAQVWFPASTCQLMTISKPSSKIFFFQTGFLCSFGSCTGTSSCRPGWPRTHRDLPTYACRVLGFRAYTTTSWHFQKILFLLLASEGTRHTYDTQAHIQAKRSNA